MIVAELSANAAVGGLNLALQTVEAAKKAGADAIKLQTWTPGTMTADPGYRIQHGAWKGKELAKLYQEAHTPWEWHKPLFERARELGMLAFSTPFDKRAVDFLQTLDCSHYKVASFEITDLPLIRYIADTKRPMIISTGMASEQEIRKAVNAARYKANLDVTLLKCTSAYPAPPEEANLATMMHLGWYLKTDFGLSDHTMTDGAACIAAHMGAAIIEKHFTLSRMNGGPDANFSLEPPDFARFVANVRAAAVAGGRLCFGPTESESTELRRGAYWAHDLPAGHTVTAEDLMTARPETALSIEEFEHNVQGKELLVAVKARTAIHLGTVSGL
jgi:N-acetylneuraminate synthase